MSDEFWKELASGLQEDDEHRLADIFEALYWIAELCVFGGDPNTLDEFVHFREQLIDMNYNDETAQTAKTLLRRFVLDGPEEDRPGAVGIPGVFQDATDLTMVQECLEAGL